MIKINFFLLKTIIILTTLSSCSKKNYSADVPYRAQVLHFTPGDGSTPGRWDMSEQVLASLEDPDWLKGTYFEIMTGRNLTISSSVGSLISGQVIGANNQSPTRFIIKNGALIPRDTTTLLLFSTFHAFEQVFEKIEASTGIKPESLTNAIGGRYQILFEPTVDERVDDSQTRISLKMNAAFNPDANNFILFRRSQGEDIPIAANVKVLAHEFGHTLFKYSFFGQRNEICRFKDADSANERLANKFFSGRLTNEYAISGLNEGYADFISYVMTGETNPLEGSFSEFDISSRALNGPEFIFSQLTDSNICRGKFYCIGTLFARSLYRITTKYKPGSVELLSFSKKAFSSLSSLEKNLKEGIGSTIMPFPTRDAARCLRQDKTNISYDGAITGAFLAAFLQGLPPGEEKTNLCREFEYRFGDVGFPKEVRGVCDSQ